MSKAFVGPKLRQLRRQNKHTQAQLAKQLGVSAAYVNLLENNQRSLTVPVLMSLSDVYGIDARSFIQTNEAEQLTELRSMARDPIFVGEAPDLQELRAALAHAPQLVDRFRQLYQDYQRLADHVQNSEFDGDVKTALPEARLFEFFKSNRNHFPTLEAAAEAIRSRVGGPQDDLYALLKRHLRVNHSVSSEVRILSQMQDTLMSFDEKRGHLELSEALDAPNRIFQLAYVAAKIEAADAIEKVAAICSVPDENNGRRLRNELLNYVAAAILMPFDSFLKIAKVTRYDLDRVAAGFGVTFEQVCHRMTTLQSPGEKGVPFFLTRIDRAGNVTKRVNPTQAELADTGGRCAVWNIHDAFQHPNVVVPQLVEMWDDKRYLTIARTTERPVFSRQTQDRRMVVVLGCEAEYRDEISYFNAFPLMKGGGFAPIGLNCHTCPRQKCTQRAHQPVHVRLNFDTHRRGATRFEN
jgi:predicted transcriptional regulator/plasmid maintenance system antidote protein VapI